VTTIAALVHDRTVWMAADTASVSGVDRRWYHTRPKIARLRTAAPGPAELLLGTCGPSSLNAFVHHHLKVGAPDPGDDDDCDRWAQSIGEAIADWAAETKPSVLDHTGQLDGGGVLGYAGRLWAVFAHHADRIPDGVLAVGSGGDLALGALAALQPHVRAGAVDPHEAVVDAVRIAARWDAGTAAGEVHVAVLGPVAAG
jgi:hypothetical protein